MNILAFVLAELVENADLITFILDAIRGKKLTKDQILQAVKDAITAGYDVKVKAEMGLK